VIGELNVGIVIAIVVGDELSGVKPASYDLWNLSSQNFRGARCSI